MTRIEAVRKTNFIIGTTKLEQINEIIDGDVLNIVDRLRNYIWNNYNVNGWYYDVESNIFCTDIIIRDFLNKYIDQFKK